MYEGGLVMLTPGMLARLLLLPPGYDLIIWCEIIIKTVYVCITLKMKTTMEIAFQLFYSLRTMAFLVIFCCIYSDAL